MKRKKLKGQSLIEYSFNHTKQRMLERYDLSLTRQEYDALCGDVRLKRNVAEVGREKQKGCIQIIYTASFKHRIVLLVYEDTRDCITTVLPGDIDLQKVVTE